MSWFQKHCGNNTPRCLEKSLSGPSPDGRHPSRITLVFITAHHSTDTHCSAYTHTNGSECQQRVEAIVEPEIPRWPLPRCHRSVFVWTRLRGGTGMVAAPHLSSRVTATQSTLEHSAPHRQPFSSGP